VAYLQAIFDNLGLIKKLLAERKNPIRPLPKVALLNPFSENKRTASKIAKSVLFMLKLGLKWTYL
jgi:hypothetical protein